MHMCIFSFLEFSSLSFKSPQNTDQSSLCCAMGPHQLCILYILVYTCQSQSPSLSFLIIFLYVNNEAWLHGTTLLPQKNAREHKATQGLERPTRSTAVFCILIFSRKQKRSVLLAVVQNYVHQPASPLTIRGLLTYIIIFFTYIIKQ